MRILKVILLVLVLLSSFLGGALIAGRHVAQEFSKGCVLGAYVVATSVMGEPPNKEVKGLLLNKLEALCQDIKEKRNDLIR